MGDNIFELIISAILAVAGYIMKHLHGKIEKTEDDLAAYKTHVAENYVHKNHLKEVVDEVKYVRGAVDDIKTMLISRGVE